MRACAKKDDHIRRALASGLYSVTDNGNVLSHHKGQTKFLKCGLMSDGYKRVSLSLNGVTHQVKLHRVVAIAKIPNPENKEIVNHIDGDKGHCHPDNLEWMTPSENNIHANRMGLTTIYKGESNSQSKLTAREVLIIREEYINTEITQAKLAKRFGVASSTISAIVNGRGWRDSV